MSDSKSVSVEAVDNDPNDVHYTGKAMIIAAIVCGAVAGASHFPGFQQFSEIVGMLAVFPFGFFGGCYLLVRLGTCL